jgi:hypothetical protein
MHFLTSRSDGTERRVTGAVLLRLVENGQLSEKVAALDRREADCARFGVVPTSYPPTPQQSPPRDTLFALLAAPKPPPSASMSRTEMSASSLSSSAVR